MNNKCGNTAQGCFPTETRDIKQNASLAELKRLLKEHLNEIAFVYVIRTVEKDEDGRFLQTGSGPNFEGDIITLCTCKHKMRSAYTPEEWMADKWVAGFSSIGSTGEQDLVYLMKVGEAFESYQDLWQNSRFVTDEVKKAKSASIHERGDIFEPTGQALPFDPANYKAPHPKHVHSHDNYWHNDVDMRYGKPSTLLVGDPTNSYLWDRPKLVMTQSGLSQGHRKMSIQELLERINDEATV